MHIYIYIYVYKIVLCKYINDHTRIEKNVRKITTEINIDNTAYTICEKRIVGQNN